MRLTGLAYCENHTSRAFFEDISPLDMSALRVYVSRNPAVDIIERFPVEQEDPREGYSHLTLQRAIKGEVKGDEWMDLMRDIAELEVWKLQNGRK